MRGRCQLCGLDPTGYSQRGTEGIEVHTLALPTLVTNVLLEPEQRAYHMEVRRFHVDNTLPQAPTSSRLDSWWATIFSTGKFPALSKLVAAMMSCFHGPQVEGCFSHMSSIMNTATARKNVSTFNTIQTVKYSLMASNKTAIQDFHKQDWSPRSQHEGCIQNVLHPSCRGRKDEGGEEN